MVMRGSERRERGGGLGFGRRLRAGPGGRIAMLASAANVRSAPENLSPVRYGLPSAMTRPISAKIAWFVFDCFQ